MGSFGENLRREREMRGVTLQEISASTKISVRFLKALEDENLAQLPGGIFSRSFVRAYAKYLGLDEDHVMAEYHLLVPAGSDDNISRIVQSRPSPKKEGSRGPVVFAVLVAAVLLAGGYLLYLYSQASRGVTEPTPVAAPHLPAPGQRDAAAGSSVVTGQKEAAASVGTSPEAMPPVVPQPEDGLTLQVAATERAWVAVDADGKMVMQRVLGPGEFENLRAKDSFEVTTGNALGIVLTLNGETLKPMGRRGEVKAVRLTRNDARKNSP